MLDVITVGSAVLDNFVLLSTSNLHPDKKNPLMQDECFVLGSKIKVKRIFQQSGGGATNAAVTFHRQGLSVNIFSKTSIDAAGMVVKDELEKEGLSTKYIIKDSSSTTGQSVILVDPNGERTILTDRGTAGHIAANDLVDINSLKARWLYLTSLNGSRGAIETALSWAVSNSVKIAWNPGMAELSEGRSVVKDWLKNISLLLLNYNEAAALIGRSEAVEVQAAHLQKLGVKRSIVTNGKNDLAYLDGKNITIIKPDVVKPVDSTGAGDAFGSGVVSGLLKGLNFRQAIELGILNSKHVVLKYGAKTGILVQH